MGLEQLLPAIATMTWQDLVMIAIGLILIYLAIAKNYEPTLLLPIGFGAILVNIPSHRQLHKSILLRDKLSKGY